MAKSELILAFNEIAEMRKLPREVIIEALKAALVSAYRKNAGVSSAQYVEARVDDRTGEPSIWVEKEVVEDVQSLRTEVAIRDARKLYPQTELGDMVIVDDTPEDFGRIAAQTAKQVILQRMREAEREAQFQEYQDRVGDLVTGTVQSEAADTVTIGLGRSEAILPRSQQIAGERYQMHDKVRAYVMEVKRTNRGPQIVVSRTHRNMLRRLLEYEVPEIYNGTVEIKSIAREPGARSKVAVAALQPGADPVGACVGMRGVRIQSIVRELNEKIDVIEWNPDSAVFISKALSPARVSGVFLDDDPDSGKTATVIVPDDQLSLAIGREGQNARLAAKLTGWRIDIKSVTEAAQDIQQDSQTDGAIADLAARQAALFEQVAAIMEKKAAGRALMPEDYHLLTDFVKQAEAHRHQVREASRTEYRRHLQEARAMVPAAAYDHLLEDTDLPLRVYNLLIEAGYNSVGQVMEQYYLDPGKLLTIAGFGAQALEDVERMFSTIQFAEPEAVEAVEASAEELPAPEGVAQVEAGMAEAVGEPQPVEAGVSEEWAEDVDDERARRAELVARMAEMQLDGAGAADVGLDEAAAPVMAPASGEEEAPVGELEEEDLFEYEDMTDEEREELQRKRAKQRRRSLVYDEEAGRVVAKRRRKSSRSRDQWTDEWEESK
jgi:N utilization substance protein A